MQLSPNLALVLLYNFVIPLVALLRTSQAQISFGVPKLPFLARSGNIKVAQARRVQWRSDLSPQRTPLGLGPTTSGMFSVPCARSGLETPAGRWRETLELFA